jgi:hypothetical protein
LKSKDEVFGKFKEFKGISLKEKSRHLGQIMEENTPQKSL